MYKPKRKRTRKRRAQTYVVTKRRRKFSNRSSLSLPAGISTGVSAKGLFSRKFGPVKLRYVEHVTPPIVATGTPSHWVFWANGLYDPNETSTSLIDGQHQPYGFDQYMLGYNHYTVTKATCKITGTNVGNQPLNMYLFVSGSKSIIADVYALMEQPTDMSCKLLTQDNGSASIGSLTRTVDISKFLSQNVLDEDQNAGHAGANPAEGVFFHLGSFCQPISETPPNASNQLTFTVAIEYTVVFHEPSGNAPGMS